jgi:Family of unknown function (DUF6297)
VGDTLTDLYMMVWVVAVYGGALVPAVRRHLRAPAPARAIAAEHAWISIAVLLTSAGLAWQGLRALGPLLATSPEQVWVVATPVDRRGWLLPRFVALLLACALGGAVATALVALLGLRGAGPGLAALAGAAYGALLAASCVTGQGASAERRWPGLSGALLVGVGAAAAALGVAGHYGDWRLPPVPAFLGPGVLMLGLPLAAVVVVLAVRTLPRLDLAALGQGANLAEAAAAASVWLDPTLLSRVTATRRWRRVGRVRSRGFVAGLGGRAGALVQAELRRVLRRPGALGVWAGLALAQYAVAVTAPSMAPISRLLLAYLAAGRLTAGLRTIAGSAGLRRALGGRELELRLVHVVVPALGTAIWWAATLPAGGPSLGSTSLLLLAGVVAAAYRAATRRPMSYGGAVVETPFGLVPVELLLQLARGPDLLGAVILLQVIMSR